MNWSPILPKLPAVHCITSTQPMLPEGCCPEGCALADVVPSILLVKQQLLNVSVFLVFGLR